MNSAAPIPLEKMIRPETRQRRLSIGFPTPPADGSMRFYPMTPESGELLVERGFDVVVEEGFGKEIKYSDEAYNRRGVRTVTRGETMSCDIVVSFPVPDKADASCLKRNAIIFTFPEANESELEFWQICRMKKATVADLRSLRHESCGDGVFKDILDLLSGRAAILKAAGLLADKENGKGIFMGGVPGTMPCEAVILGAGRAGVEAARMALALGASVKIFDHDSCLLGRAMKACGERVMTSVYLPKVLMRSLREADIVVYNEPDRGISFSSEVAEEMKKGVMVFNLSCHPAPFDGFVNVDLSRPIPEKKKGDERRRCYVGAAMSVARSASMAFSDETVNLFSNLDGLYSRLNKFSFIRSIRQCVMMYEGRTVRAEIAVITDSSPIDIDLLMQITS